MSTTTSGAEIRYTTDGSTPTAASTLYTSALNVATQTTFKVIGVKAGWSPSAVATVTYNFNYGTATTPTVSPATGTYTDTVTVTMSAQANATIRYTTNAVNVCRATYRSSQAIEA